MSPCPECEERRKKIIAAMQKLAEWVKHPVGPPPGMPPNATVSVRQSGPIIDQTKTGKT
jgi:hypothetical protein